VVANLNDNPVLSEAHLHVVYSFFLKLILNGQGYLAEMAGTALAAFPARPDVPAAACFENLCRSKR
jgi:hypothetical protein